MLKSPQTSEPAGEDTQVLNEWTAGVGGKGESDQMLDKLATMNNQHMIINYAQSLKNINNV